MSSSDPIRPRPFDPPEASFNLNGIARLFGTGLGFVVLVLGLWAVLRVFTGLFGALTTPDTLAAGMEAWSQALTNVDASTEINGQKVDVKGLLVVGSFWLGWIVLSWLSVSLLLAGAKIISWTTSDQEAVKRILGEALGNWRELHKRD